MTKIIKKIDGLIPVVERTIKFTQADAVTGDFLMVSDSLGKPGSHVAIEVETGGSLSIKFNTLQKTYPSRQNDNSFMYSQGMNNVSLGQEIESQDGVATIILAAGETWSQDQDFPVKNIKIVSESGDWSILIS